MMVGGHLLFLMGSSLRYFVYCMPSRQPRSWARKIATSQGCYVPSFNLIASDCPRYVVRSSRNPAAYVCYNLSSLKEIRMSNTTTTPTTPTAPEVKAAPISLTPNAIAKVKGIMAQQNPAPAGLRVGVVGGGCSGFSYSLQFDNSAGMMDKVFDMDGLKVFVDATSIMYLNGCRVDYVETLEGAGFKFENPNVKSTCGCGSSFNV